MKTVVAQVMPGLQGGVPTHARDVTGGESGDVTEPTARRRLQVAPAMCRHRLDARSFPDGFPSFQPSFPVRRKCG